MAQAVVEQETQEPDGEFVPLEEATRRLGITRDRLENYLRRGKLRHLRQERHGGPGGFRWLVNLEEVRWCMEHPRPSGRPPKK